MTTITFKNQTNKKYTIYQYITIRKISQMNNFSKYAVAVIVLLSCLPLGYQFLSRTMNSEEIFAANFTTEKVLDLKNHRGLEETGDDRKKSTKKQDISKALLLRTKAISSYNGKKYSEAINLFEKYLASEIKFKKKKEIELYLAKAYLAENKVLEARKILTQLQKEGNKRIKQQAEWYLVLTLIKENNVEQAQNELNKILFSKSPHAHKDKALKLQQQIDKYYVQ